MACCAKRASGKGGDDRKISVTMEETKIEKFDEIFKKASDILANAEAIRYGLQDSRDNCLAISGAYQLKDGNMADAFQCWLWSLGCEMDIGNFKPKLDVKVEGTSVKTDMDIKMPEGKATEEQAEFLENFKHWVTTIGSAAARVEEINTKVSEISSEVTELTATAKDLATEAGLGAMDLMKAVKAVASNGAKLTKSVAKVAMLAKVLADAIKDLTTVGSGMPAAISGGVENSKAGKEKGAKTAKEYAAKQHTKEKIPEADAAKSPVLLGYTARKEAGEKPPTLGAAVDISDVIVDDK